MGINVIYGRAGSGKTTFCLHEIKKQIEKGLDLPIILLVPEQYTLQAEKELIKVLGTGGILKIEVLSFRRLAYRVFQEVGGITRPHLQAAGKSMILSRILDLAKEDLRLYAKAAHRQGFVSKLSTLITEFKRYRIAPEDLLRASESMEQDPLLREKCAELYLLYLQYQEALSHRYADGDEDLTLAAGKLPSSEQFKNARIWIDGFSGFTPQEYHMVACLLELGCRIRVALATDSLQEHGEEGTDVFHSVKKVAKRLQRLAEETGASWEEPVHLKSQPLPRFLPSPELAHLEKNYFAYPYQVYSHPTEQISLFASVNIFAEIEETARDIIRLCRDRGWRYREIGVVTRNLSGYEHLLEAVFSQYEIPYFLDRKVEVSHHPLVRMILAVLDIFIENWTYEAVFRYLKTGLTGIDPSDIDQIENYVLACGIRGNRWTKEEAWQMIPELMPDEKDLGKHQPMLDQMNQIRQQIIQPLLKFQQGMKRRKTGQEISAGLYEFLVNLDVPQLLEERIEGLRRDGRLDLANEYAQVWNIVMEVLDQAVEILGEDSIGLERYARTLQVGFAEYQIGLIPASLDQVLIGSIERSRSHELKALYILGVNDGIFPAASSEEGILSDQDRGSLQSLGIELAGDTRSQAFDEQYLVYRALTTAQNTLRISWPIADGEGRSMRPSLIISRLRKLFPRIQESSNLLQETPEDILPWLTGKTPVFEQLIRAFRESADGKNISPAWQEVYSWYQGQKDWQPKLEGVHRAFQYLNKAEPVSPRQIEALYGNPAYASVSRLEKYNACPFAFFVQYGLGAKERKIYQFSPPDVGTFLHGVIENFSKRVEEQNLSWRSLERSWIKDQVSEIVEDTLKKMQGSGLAGSKRLTTLTLRLKRVVTRALWLIAEHFRRSNFEPIGYEVGFGAGEKFPPIIIELESGQTIHLVGRIDRVDALKTEEGTYLRVIDYKSGNKDFQLSDVYYGLQIQLLTYLDALTSTQGGQLGDPLLPAGVLYFRLDDPLVRSEGTLQEEEIEKAIMKQLKMNGLILADVKLVKEMDKTIEGPSLIIPARMNKGDVLGKSSAASFEQFGLLRSYTNKLLKELSGEMMGGDVSIKPYKKKKQTSCDYCSFGAVCQFDPSRKENRFRILKEKREVEVWKHLRDS